MHIKIKNTIRCRAADDNADEYVPNFTTLDIKDNSQNVADDSKTPHVRGVVDWIVLYNLGCHELRRTVQDSSFHIRAVLASESEVDNLDPVTGATQTKYIFRLNTRKHYHVYDSNNTEWCLGIMFNESKRKQLSWTVKWWTILLISKIAPTIRPSNVYIWSVNKNIQ